MLPKPFGGGPPGPGWQRLHPALAAGINLNILYLNTNTSDGSTLVVSIEQLESSILSHALEWVAMLVVRFHLKLDWPMLREKVASSTFTLGNSEVWFARLPGVPHIDRLRVRAPPSGVRSNLRKWCWRKLWSHFAMYSVAPMGEGAVLVCYPLLMTPSFWSELLV